MLLLFWKEQTEYPGDRLTYLFLVTEDKSGEYLSVLDSNDRVYQQEQSGPGKAQYRHSFE